MKDKISKTLSNFLLTPHQTNALTVELGGISQKLPMEYDNRYGVWTIYVVPDLFWNLGDQMQMSSN